MKETLRALFRFSRLERLGIIALSVLIVILLVVLFFLRQLIPPPSSSPEQQAQLQQQYQAWLAQQEVEDGTPVFTQERRNAAPLQPFPFDPNTLDSAGWVQIGLPTRTIKGLLNWRRKGKHFYKPEDLKPLYNLSAAEYEQLAPFIKISGATSDNRFAFKNDYRASLPDFIELNTVDSAMLNRAIKGIGASLAHKIIARRTALGGFFRYEQLLEVYRFPDTVFKSIQARLHLNPELLQKISLNKATLEQLTAHPYIGEKMAKNILLYREGINNYESVGQLRQVPLMTEENYRKIAPYCSVD